MLSFDAAELAAVTGGRWLDATPEDAPAGFHFDARKLKEGEAFVALAGRRDGHDFAGQALAAGASALLVGRALDTSAPQLLVADTLEAMGQIAAAHRRRFSEPVIGVTGSCGKTSTKEMLRLALGAERCLATAGNWNNRIGVPMTMFGLDPARHRAAVIEAGINQPGEMDALGRIIAADLVVLTNIGPAHLELLGSLDGIAEEKSKLIRFARQGAPLICPASALAYPALADFTERAHVLLEGDQAAPANVPPERIHRLRAERAGPSSTRLQLESSVGGSLDFDLASGSAGICANAGLAAIAARLAGRPPAAVAAGLAAWRPEGSRGRIAASGARRFYIDCYNANPASMIDSLAAFDRAFASGEPRCFVLAAMNELGPEGARWHERVGQSLPFREGDRYRFIGPDASTAAYAVGATAAGIPATRILCAETVETIRPELEDFSGAIFLKGSRSHRLESLLPESLHL